MGVFCKRKLGGGVFLYHSCLYLVPVWKVASILFFGEAMVK